MRKRYVQRHGRLIPRDAATARHHMVQGDLEPFVSHVDGSIIGSQADLRDHNKRLGVASFDEQLPDIERAQKEREKFYQGMESPQGYDRKRRIEALRFATDLECADRTPADRAQMIANYQDRNDDR